MPNAPPVSTSRRRGGEALDVRNDADKLEDRSAPSVLALVYFDQLLDNLGVTDSFRDKEVRDALAPMR